MSQLWYSYPTVPHSNDYIIDSIKRSTSIAIEPVHGRDGLWGIAVQTDHDFAFITPTSWPTLAADVLATRVPVCAWDVRRCPEFCISDDHVIYDVKSLYNGDSSFPSLVRTQFQSEDGARFLELDQKMIAHKRAAKTARITLPTQQVVPADLITEWVKLRVKITKKFYDFGSLTASPVPALNYSEFERRWPFIRALRQVELNGIHIDPAFITRALGETQEQATSRALRSLQEQQKNSLVTTLLNPMGGKTGRLRHEGGFNTLGIPKGDARQAITSRWYEGKIYTFDFNAIDYRCIVKHIGGEVAKLYEGATDFHERTASFIFKNVTPGTRQAIKYLSYIYIYGGSEDTLAAKTGWSSEEVRKVLDLLDKKIGPVKEFREALWMQVQGHQFMDIPGGRRVYCQDADSSGKLIGLFAQSYSSYIFEEAFTRVHKKLQGKLSCIIFSVHDELVIDCHPDEFALMEELIPLMESDGYAVKMKAGNTYGDAV